MKGSIIMNTELNNAIVKNKKVYAENEEATHTNIKTLDDIIAAMDRINAKYDKPARIKTVDDIIPVMEQVEKEV